MQRQAQLQKELEDMKAEMALLKAVVGMQHQQQTMLPPGHVVMDQEPLSYTPPLPVSTAHIDEMPPDPPSPPEIDSRNDSG